MKKSPKKPVKPLSTAWTAEDRLRVVSSLLDGLHDDICAGRYSEVGRPNITSLQHILHDPSEVLEQYRVECETYVAEHEAKFPATAS